MRPARTSRRWRSRGWAGPVCSSAGPWGFWGRKGGYLLRQMSYTKPLEKSVVEGFDLNFSVCWFDEVYWVWVINGCEIPSATVKVPRKVCKKLPSSFCFQNQVWVVQAPAPSPAHAFYYKNHWVKFVNNFGSRNHDKGSMLKEASSSGPAGGGPMSKACWAALSQKELSCFLFLSSPAFPLPIAGFWIFLFTAPGACVRDAAAAENEPWVCGGTGGAAASGQGLRRGEQRGCSWGCPTALSWGHTPCF